MLPPGCGLFYNDDPLTYNKEPLAHSKKDMNMKSRAAVAFAAGKPLEIVAVPMHLHSQVMTRKGRSRQYLGMKAQALCGKWDLTSVQ